MTKPLTLLTSVLPALFLASMSPLDAADNDYITLQSTTSTQNSGLFEHVLPIFTKETGIDVHVVAVGTGQALKNAQNGDGDVVLVHSLKDEEKFVSEGWGVKRHDVMYNDFIIVGPVSDPAGIRGVEDAPAALRRIARGGSTFASRGDESGTHKAELALWKDAGVDPRPASGDWYLETGSGMGATLNLAVGKQAYTLADRATWFAFGNKPGLEVLVEGDPKLFNQYGVILVNPARHPNVKAKEGQAFVEWITSPRGQAAIESFKIGGKQLFFPNARQD